VGVPIQDASGFSGTAERVFQPRDETAAVEILREANATLTPVTIGGAWTGLTGGSVPDGGWVIDLRSMNSLSIVPGRATTGPGTLLRDVQSAAARDGQLYGPDPTENTSSIGGNIANNSSGSRSFRYGDTRANVLALRVALMDGTVLDIKRGDPIDFDVPAIPLPRTTKHSAGYRLAPGMDWVDLFVGSEGTLGVVTRAELKLLPAPADYFSGVIFFDNDSHALDAVEAWRGVDRLNMLEYMDANSLRVMDLDAAAALLIEQEVVSGNEVDEWLERLEAAGALLDTSWIATSDRDRERFRQFRHELPERVNAMMRRRGLVKLSSDFAVLFENNRIMMGFYRNVLEREFPGQYTIWGHIGDAHVHVNILPPDERSWERAREIMPVFAREAVRLGGVVGAEHGLGKRKAHFMQLQYTPGQIDAMKAVKRRMDPNWLLGRGNLFAAD
jgi:FAD/FMN-containing dehydrogenase